MTDSERAALCAIVQKHLAVQTQEMENYGSFSSNPGVPKDNYGELAAAIAADIQAAREADLTEWLKRTGLSNDVSEAEQQLLGKRPLNTPASNDTARLDYLIAAGVYVREGMSGSGWCVVEDLGNEGCRFLNGDVDFPTARDAIDAAMIAAAPEGTPE